MSGDVTCDSENFIYIFRRKRKLQLSKLKSAILQLNTRYYRNCYTEKANKTNYMEFVWKDEHPPNSADLSPLDYHAWGAMLEMYQCYTHIKADQHLRCRRTLCKRSMLACLKARINAAILSFRKRLQMYKNQPVDISIMQSELMLLASICHVSLQ